MTDTPTKTDLLPCPFCGGEAYIRIRGTNYQLREGGCQKCGSSGPIKTSDQEANDSWNTRTQPTADIAGLDEAFKDPLIWTNEKQKNGWIHSKPAVRPEILGAARLYQASQKGAGNVEAADNLTPREGWMCVVRKDGTIEHVKTAATLMEEANRVSGADAETIISCIDKEFAYYADEFPDWSDEKLNSCTFTQCDSGLTLGMLRTIRARLADQKEGYDEPKA